VEIKNSYLSGVAATCAVITNCQQYSIGNVTSSGVGFQFMPTNQTGIEMGTTQGTLIGGQFGILPGQANQGNNPAVVPFAMYMVAPNFSNVSSTGAGSLAANVYCAQFTGFDATAAANETNGTNVTCTTVGASSSITYDFGGAGAQSAGTVYPGFNFYFCSVASGTCTPNQKLSSLSTSSDGGSGRLYTFSSTSGATSATPPLTSKAMMSWLGVDASNSPWSCFFCVGGSSDAWPIAIGLNSASLTGLSGKGINLYTQMGIKVGATTFSNLTACSSSLEGAFRAITDSTTSTWGATITGSGSNHVLAYCDGTNWTVMAK
jgi:hypothetical protein